MGIGGSLVQLVASSMLLAATAQAAPPDLFRDAAGPPGQGGGLRHRYVRIDTGLLGSDGDVRINLFDDAAVTSRDTRRNDRASGLRSWSSDIVEDDLGYALFVVRGDAAVGQVGVDGTVFEIRPVGGDVHEIREIDVAAMPPEAEPRLAGQPEAEVLPRAARAVTRDAVDSIRVLVVYTPAAAAASADIEAEAQLAVDAANTAYTNSSMATRLQLIATAETPYTETGDIFSDLDALAGQSDGSMDEVHSLRNAYLADFVALLVDVSPDYCGLATLMSVVTPDFEDEAFSVTYRPCAVGNLTLAHEIGHNMGCQHDRANASSAPAYSWAYGYQDPQGDFRTVMAVPSGCAGSCPRVAHFANPSVDYLGDPTGIDGGAPDAAACALAIDSTSTVTCDFRTLVPPGVLAASSTFTDRVQVSFEHPWPWSFQVYRAESGGPMVALAITPGSPFDDETAAPGTSYDYWVSTRTELDGESAVVGPVTGVRAIADCGNSITESPAEECDDGNLAAGDGCAPDCTSEIPLDEAAADCVAAMNDRAIRVSRAQGKENLACLSAAAAGSEPAADACILADRKGKIATARAKMASVDESLCTSPPSCGYAGATAAGDAAEGERRAFLRDLFGADLSAAVLAKAADAEGASCQKGIAKSADKLVDAGLASFLSCKKDRLSSQSVSTAESIEACFDEVASEAATDGTRLAMALARIATTRLRKCAESDLAVAFPGECGATIGAAFDACVATSASCRTCRFLNLADGLWRDCDKLDNGAADASCAP